MMKKGKVEWLYKVAMLLENGQFGIDFMFTQSRLGKMEVQEIAEAVKTDVHIEFLGTVIRPPKKDNATFTYDYLTKDERARRIDLANELAYKEQQREEALKSATENKIQ